MSAQPKLVDEPMKKKLHWTQRPENKAKLARLIRKMVKTKNRGKKNVTVKRSKEETPETDPHREDIIYAFARTEAWLEFYANSIELPKSFVTEQVAKLLLVQTRRKGLGAGN